ncbi:Small Nuclear ribonucleoprotein splicing factor [Phaffia rhodozyma]|uniref:U6 snRNA-associated Sm-like protein LSm1 n=1 Tax=Phaffia rhodozyma TaxID=264483 RepID=A0A0F7SF01_PHARH|nr:Small Nuclear ribonucleoprotein splicing factor [Phaffia rhodozyma]
MNSLNSLIPFTTSGSLVDCVDKKMLVVLRDGRKYIGVLRSYDQFANLVLSGSFERLFHPPTSTYADIPRGVFLIRGENVVLIGEIDLDVEDEPPVQLIPAPIPDVLRAQKIDSDRKAAQDAIKTRVLHGQGFSTDNAEGDAY